MDVIKTLVVDDHALFAETLAARLGREPDIDVLPIAQDAAKARTLLSAMSPAVVVLDLMLGTETSLSLLEEITERHPGSRVVVLTGSSAVEHAVAGVRRGARAWLEKTTASDHLVHVIRAVHRGHTWIPPEMLGAVLEQLAAPPEQSAPSPLDVLTPRERDVLQCAVDGLRRPAIADQLGLSPNTVRTHTQNLLGKLNVRSTLAAVSFARRHGMRPQHVVTGN